MFFLISPNTFMLRYRLNYNIWDLVDNFFLLVISFKTTNNKVEYEALIVWLQLWWTLEAKYVNVETNSQVIVNEILWKPVKKISEHKMEVTEMHMVRWMCEHTLMDRIRNQEFKDKLGLPYFWKNARK